MRRFVLTNFQFSIKLDSKFSYTSCYIHYGLLIDIKNMKQKIRTEIYRKDFKGNYEDVRFSDLPKDIQKNDIIEIRREESFYSENYSYDAYTELVIIREREETDEEYQKRIFDNEYHEEELRKRRYENYLKLKSEFES